MLLKALGHQQENFGILNSFFFFSKRENFMKSKAEGQAREEESWGKII